MTRLAVRLQNWQDVAVEGGRGSLWRRLSRRHGSSPCAGEQGDHQENRLGHAETHRNHMSVTPSVVGRRQDRCGPDRLAAESARSSVSGGGSMRTSNIAAIAVAGTIALGAYSTALRAQAARSYTWYAQLAS